MKRAVLDFGKDTQGLLSLVYRTRPMLRAAPGEDLDFYTVAVDPGPQPDRVREAKPDLSSRKADKRRREAVEELRTRIQQRLRHRLSQRRVVADPPPRYDEVFAQGQQQLDQLAGEPLADREFEGQFSDDIWHSRGRAETELP